MRITVYTHRGLGIIDTVDAVVRDEAQIALKIEQQIVRGHGAAREEGARHPAVVLILIQEARVHLQRPNSERDIF